MGPARTTTVRAPDSSQVVCQLLAASADVHATDHRGYSALSVASFKGHTEVVRALCDAKADVHWRAQGDTPLALASRRGREATVQLLLERGAAVEPRCVEQARGKGHDGVVAMLRAREV
eukprot:3953113-Prymnesium_polylepis.1